LRRKKRLNGGIWRKKKREVLEKCEGMDPTENTEGPDGEARDLELVQGEKKAG